MENLVLQAQEALTFIAQYDDGSKATVLGGSMGDALNTLEEKGLTKGLEGLYRIHGPLVTKQKYLDDSKWL